MIDNSLLRKALTIWGIENQECELIAFRENLTYKTFNNIGTQVVLRIHRKNYSSKKEINSELNWLQALNQGKINVPKPVKSINNKLLEIIDGRYISVLTWINGKHLSEINAIDNSTSKDKVFYNLGKELAKLHKFSDNWIKPGNFYKREWNIDGLVGENPLWDKFWENPKLSNKQIKEILFLRDECYKILNNNIDNLDYGLIHADAVRDNVLFQNNLKVNLIDFDDSGFGFRIFDLATTLLHFINDKNFNKIKDQLTKGYLDTNFLNLKLIDIFILVRSFTYVGWNIKRIEEPGGIARNKKYINNVFNVVKKLDIQFNIY